MNDRLIKGIVSKMSLRDKIKICSGASFWKTEEIPQYQIPSIFLCDGPHGLRKQEGDGDHLGLNASIKTTCFPTASLAASTFNTELVRQMGEAIGKEAVELDVNIVLGPGVNMKRNPLCGRNFEYYSEDPYLSGKMGAAWIQGVESQGVGTSLKHFAFNNQENKRMSTNVLADERAKREYYLPAFEIAVNEGKPATVMCAYNKVDGTYCSDNAELLNQILRRDWGFEGAVITDWGAMNDRVAAFKAGTDLEMPGSNSFFDNRVEAAVRSGSLMETDINHSVERLLSLIYATTDRKKSQNLKEVLEKNHVLAKKIAAEGGILLKNSDNILPLQKGIRVGVIGSLSKNPRYQGTGSSQVTPTRLDSILTGLEQYTKDISFAEGYTLEDKTNEQLKSEAITLAQSVERVILCIGLTEVYESEGFDREHMKLPENQLDLLEELAKVIDNLIVVLVGGSAIEMEWESKVGAILHMQLAGQAGGIATAELLFGVENPSGRLSETYPVCYADVVSSGYYMETPRQGAYMESLYCGYRYFTSAEKSVRYPFGYGLSYSQFRYSNMEVQTDGENNVLVRVDVTNIGACDGAEVVQLYVKPETRGVFRPKRELKGFDKVYLKTGETNTVTLKLTPRSFSIFDVKNKTWIIESGDYCLEIAKNCSEIILQEVLSLSGTEPVKSQCSDWFYTLDGIPDKNDFITLFGDYSEQKKNTKGSYTMENSIMEMKSTSILSKIMYKGMEKTIAKTCGGKVDYKNSNFKMLMMSASDNPVKSMPLFSPDIMSEELASFFVDSANGHTLRGLSKLIRKKNK